MTHCRCGVCLLRRMGLRGSLFLKLDCNLDKRARGPREGAANPDKLLEEPCAGSPSGPHPQRLWKTTTRVHIKHSCTHFSADYEMHARHGAHLQYMPSSRAEAHQCVIVFRVFFPPLLASLCASSCLLHFSSTLKQSKTLTDSLVTLTGNVSNNLWP